MLAALLFRFLASFQLPTISPLILLQACQRQRQSAICGQYDLSNCKYNLPPSCILVGVRNLFLYSFRHAFCHLLHQAYRASSAISAETLIGNLSCDAVLKSDRGVLCVALPYIESEGMRHYPDNQELDMRRFPHSDTPNTKVVQVMLMGMGMPFFPVVTQCVIPEGEAFSLNHTTTFAKCCCGCPKSVCDQCGQVAKLSGCGRCRKAWYCSKECQTAAWPMHKAECGK